MKEKMEMCLGEIECLEEKLCGALKCELDKGLEHVEVHEAGEIVDMIKDLAEAEKYCHEACYYKSVHEAMEKAGEENRYGWTPTWPHEWGDGRFGWYPPEPMYEMYGYNNGSTSESGSRGGSYDGHGNSSGSGSSGYRPSQPRDSRGRFTDSGGRMGFHEEMAEYRMPMHGSESEYGRAYDRYQESRKHFTETGSTTDREEMNQHAREHLDATITTMGEIYKSSDPELKRQIKMNINKLMSDMN